jgi:hypothetical protein
MFALALPRPGKISRVFMYPWPVSNFDYAMDDALDIATSYLLLTGVAVLFKEAQVTAAEATVTAWQCGIKHRINSLTRRLRQSRKKCPCAREPISRQLFGPYSGCVTCRASNDS